MLHGGPGAHHDYLLPGFDALAQGRELIYYDQRGGGQSPVAREVPVGWKEQVADLEALFERKGIPHEQRVSGVAYITKRGVESLGELTTDELQTVADALSQRPDAAPQEETLPVGDDA